MERARKRQRLLILSQVYVPDPASVGQHLHDFAAEMARRGHDVVVYCSSRGYDDPTLPISCQSMPERPVRIGAGSWLGHGTVVLPGADIGRHVVVGANSVVTGCLPDHCVAAGNPARVVKQQST